MRQHHGQIYLIEHPAAQLLKIGISREPLRRLLTLRAEAKHKGLRLIGIIKDNATGRDEAALHRKFKRFHFRGEWFKDHPSIRKLVNADIAPRSRSLICIVRLYDDEPLDRESRIYIEREADKNERTIQQQIKFMLRNAAEVADGR